MENIADIILKVHAYDELQRLQELSKLKLINIIADASAISQTDAIITEKTLWQQLPATIAIKSNEVLLESIQIINRQLLPLQNGAVDYQATKRKVFSIRTSDGQLRSIQCIYNRANIQEIEFFLNNNGIVATKFNNHIVKYLKDNMHKFSFYWIRRKVYNDGKWYLMLQIEYKE